MSQRNRRKFESYDEAKAYLFQKGTPEYFGVIHLDNSIGKFYHVYNLHLPSGISYHVNLYHDGLVETWLKDR